MVSSRTTVVFLVRTTLLFVQFVLETHCCWRVQTFVHVSRTYITRIIVHMILLSNNSQCHLTWKNNKLEIRFKKMLEWTIATDQRTNRDNVCYIQMSPIAQALRIPTHRRDKLFKNASWQRRQQSNQQVQKFSSTSARLQLLPSTL